MYRKVHEDWFKIKVDLYTSTTLGDINNGHSNIKCTGLF